MGWGFTFKITLEINRQNFLCPGKSPVISRLEYTTPLPDLGVA